MNYRMYYYPSIDLIYQYGDDFVFSGLDYFRYLNFKITVYHASKTRVPALFITFIIFGLGFEFCTHAKK